MNTTPLLLLTLALGARTGLCAQDPVPPDPPEEPQELQDDWSDFSLTPVPPDLAGPREQHKLYVEHYLVRVRSGPEGRAKLGTGLVVGRSGEDCHVLAPRSVLGQGDSVCFAGQDTWIEARELIELDADTALLRVPSPASLPADLFARLVPAMDTTVFDGVPGFVVALGDEDGAPVWLDATIRGPLADRVAFQAPDLDASFVGGALFNVDLAYVGLVLPGTDVRSDAASWAGLSERAADRGVEVGLSPDLVHDALVTCSRTGRLVSLVVRTHSHGRYVHRWFGLKLRSQAALEFYGMLMGYKVAGATAFELGRGDLSFHYPKNLGLDFDLLGPFTFVPGDPLPGFLLFTAGQDGVHAQLAIPRTEAQLLGTSVLTRHVTSNWIHNLGDRENARYLSGVAGGLDMVRVGGRPPLFPMLASIEEEMGGLRFELPEELSARGARLTARVALADGRAKSLRPAQQARLEGYEFCVWDADSGEALDVTPLGGDGSQVVAEIPPGTREIRWSVRGKDLQLTLAILEGAVIEPL